MKDITRCIKIFILTSIVGFVLLQVDTTFAQSITLSDSTLKLFSVQELVKLRKLLGKEWTSQSTKQEKTREKGIEISEDFLDLSKTQNSNQDKILIRIAEYYVEEENLDFERRYEEFEKKYDEYEAQLKLYQEGTLKVPPAEPEPPERNYEKSLSIYDLLINNFPESDLLDDAYYNKAFLAEDMGYDTLASETFQTMIDQIPESEYAPEAYLKLAENYFYPKPGDSRELTILKLQKATQLYQNVLDYKDSPRYDEALYKLGWTYYRLAGEDPNYYTDAIVNFMAVVQDIENNKHFDPSGEYVLANVKPEAIEYIAASFTDTAYHMSGVSNTKEFIEKLGKPDFGVEIMEKLGDRYAKITLWDNSIRSHRELLDMYPDYVYAPRIQKKIAEAFLAQKDFELAFQEREMLFQTYNPKSEWYAQLEQKDFPERITALDVAYGMSEEGLRKNVLYLYEVAQKDEADTSTSVQESYEKFSGLASSYLNNYPTDENAYEINWAQALILDTKLYQFREAFEEYLRVSNDYLEDIHREDAAINAIAVADTLVAIESETRDTTYVEGVDVKSVPTRALTEEEKMLGEAYDNFIKLFPSSPETPRILADAGALYYNHRQFDIAKKYYKTMVSKFPEAEQKNIGLISLMNSYFFLGQYQDAEIVARKILEAPNIPPEQVEAAKQKLGQSIYKGAEKYEQEGLYTDAAREYLRVYYEAAQYVDFSDRALLKAGQNFEQTREWQKAIDTYEILVIDLPESKYALTALGNIAEDYKELEDYKNVGRAYERIYERYPETKDGESALYNASLFYAKGENWSEAIRANNLYINKFPNNPESKDLLFENSNHYLMLGSLGMANQIYRQFAVAHPDDPRAIEAFYNRGNYYFKKARYDSAKMDFNFAISKSEEFARSGKDPNLFYAAEANYKLGLIVYQEYKDIELGYPASQLRVQLQQKSRKLEEVRTNFNKVIEYGSARGFEAIYRIAEAYEEFAEAIANQELQPNLTPEKELVERDRVFKASVPAYEQAVEEYKSAVINIPKLAAKLNISMEESEEPDEPAEPVVADVADSVLIVRKEATVDSSSQVAIKWYNNSKEKISHILYDVAERSSGFITAYLQSPNPETGIKAIAYDGLVLQNLVKPAIIATNNAHLKNVQVSSELDLINKYVKESKRKILLTGNIGGNEFSQLFTESGDLYAAGIPVFKDLLERGESATTPNGMDYYDYQDGYLMQLIYFMNTYSQNAVNEYVKTLQFAQANGLQNDATLTTEERLFAFIYESGNRMSELSKLAESEIEIYLDKYENTQNTDFQLASSFFDDQSVELRNFSEQIFDIGFNLSKEFDIENIWTKLILSKLVELDPGTYLSDVPRQEIEIISDNSWLAIIGTEPGWNFKDYDDSNWKSAKEVSLPLSMYFPVLDSLGISPSAIWAVAGSISGGSTTVEGSLSLDIIDKELEDTTNQSGINQTKQNQNDQAFTEPQTDTLTAIFRKSFDLSAIPVGGWIAITGDKTYRFYLNDTYVIGVENSDFTLDVSIISFEAFSTILNEGKNVISCSVTDIDGPPRYGLRFYMLLEALPGEVTVAAEKIRESEEEKIDFNKLKETVILNKNRVVK
jgi:tetratricopeptide (TPR) repeat protein